ncbi:MAG TPA: ribose-phosphate pyrophosphokinase [Ignavibacteriales bacterium]|nr:ribose-phosphate pyrophosphokinase [Ignavibacteriales bacterium]HOL81862.1 ribose-phosphate pyrophosphokinase [Ignavibacteriales bacterium]HOM65037.1 ribose-phosphate pyrophosphokinase [Ignavibacteriales bacterium]HPD67231.1 ribose-phosphate pyrophosphokinase [Ignavibacteriales bacterium]HPP34001.1 ribose-phosphate pyrophosphokinase [Ignavibacteriales bacterium]
MTEGEFRLFSGRSNYSLGEKIAKHLNVELSLVEIKNFSDGEIWVQYPNHIRGKDVFIVQSTNPPSDNLMELLILIDAAKRASAKRVTAVIPYFGYARQDRKDQPRVSITAKLVANLLTVSRVDRILTMDLHAPQIQGFFDIPFDHLTAYPVFLKHFKNIENLVVVSPDVGGIKRAREVANYLGLPLVVIDKRRQQANQAEAMNVIGNVEQKNCLIIDDLMDTGGTFLAAAKALKEHGALKIYGAVTHALLSGNAIENVNNSVLEELVVTDTLNLEKRDLGNKIKIKSVSEIFAEAIIRIHKNESISKLFD